MYLNALLSAGPWPSLGDGSPWHGPPVFSIFQKSSFQFCEQFGGKHPARELGGLRSDPDEAESSSSTGWARRVG